MLVALSGYIGVGKDEVAKMIQFLTSYMDMGFKEPSADNYINHYSKFDHTGDKALKWEIRKFAGKLKQIVSLLTGIPVADLEKESVKSSELGPEWWYWKDYSNSGIRVPSNKEIDAFMETKKEGTGVHLCKPTLRSLLQELGTDACRDRVHPDIWVNALFADYTPDSEKPCLCKGTPACYQPKGYSCGKIKGDNWIISDLRFPNELKAIKDRGGICIRINRPHEKIAMGPPDHKRVTLEDSGKLHLSETALNSAEFDYTIYNNGTLEELLEAVRTMLLHFKIIS